MLKHNNSGATGRERIARMTLGMALMLSLFAAPALTSASSVAQAGSGTVTIPAGGSVTLTARGFCMDYGKPFPTQSVSVTTLAPDNIREALNYSIQKGYTNGNPAQVELAIWYLGDNTWHDASHDTAQEIVTNATSANMPAAGSGTALTDAVTQNKVTVTATFTAQTAGHYYGDGQITINNTSGASMDINLPIGTVFAVPGAANDFQRLAVYQLAVPAQATSSPAASATVAGTASVVATGTVSGTATVAATATVVGTASVVPTSVVSGTMTATPLASATAFTSPTVVATAPVVSSPTAVATTIVETPTAMIETPTTAPVIETPTNTGGVLPVATEVPTPSGPSTLPQTGAGDGGMFAFTLLAVLVAMAALVAGGTLLRKANARK